MLSFKPDTWPFINKPQPVLYCPDVVSRPGFVGNNAFVV